MMKIAIIGTGIAGLGAAYLLHPHYDITVYEKNNYPGGHSRTIDVNAGGGILAVDTGFIVFNYRNYYHLSRLFDHLGVPVQKSDMSFGASIADGWLEYGSKGMFAQRLNLCRPAYWKMLADILRFNRQALHYLEKDYTLTLGEMLDDLKMGDWFRRYYLQAMGAAIWSCSVETILQFPASTFTRFFHNHGLLTVNDHPQWYTVTGGSREYVRRLMEPYSGKVLLNRGIMKIKHGEEGKILVRDSGGDTLCYDRVVFACHADEALAMIENPDQMEQDILGSFSFQKNRVIVHGDTSFMPQRRGCWASWVYLSEQSEDKEESVSLSYWMNNLQGLDRDTPVIITLNPGRRPREELIYDEHNFTHPVFNRSAVMAQDHIPSLQGHRNSWYCGAYQRYGFHEDGLLSAVNVAKSMGVDIPWE